ncbi:hypothetical protein [Actinoplanes regularis]|uniref:hypothetical protein n=1 Tax=Actinoplanes regularis TaxID=52697 RepID=UPI001EF236DB|nr:hypothetical protein [Actinoplanes regularis]
MSHAPVRFSSGPVRTRSLADGAGLGAGSGGGPELREDPASTAPTSADTPTTAAVERLRRKTGGTIGQLRIGRTGDGELDLSRQNFRVRSAGFLSERQRRFAWLGFFLAAFQAPVAAKVIDDASWFFAVVVALVVATVIIADDAQRRRPAPADYPE